MLGLLVMGLDGMGNVASPESIESDLRLFDDLPYVLV